MEPYAGSPRCIVEDPGALKFLRFVYIGGLNIAMSPFPAV